LSLNTEKIKEIIFHRPAARNLIIPPPVPGLTSNDHDRINAISGKAMRRGLTLTAFHIDALIDKSDRKLFRKATQPGHCLRHLLPPKTSTYSSYQLRKRQHPYLLSTV